MAIKSTGMVRNVDELGRVVLPKELRREKKIEAKSLLEIYVKDESIFMKKYESGASGEEEAAVGIVRRVDELGRMVIPKETRNMLKIQHKDLLEIYVDDEGYIIFKKYEPACIFCNGLDDLVVYENKKICRKCIAKLSEL